MKYLLILLLIPVAAKAQFIWPVEPKNFTDAAGQVQTVTGIQANTPAAIQFDTTVAKDYPIYIRFVKEDGSTYQEIPTTLNRSADKMAEKNNIPFGTARQMIFNILKELSFPTDKQTLLSTAALFASSYGYTLDINEE